MLIIPAIDLKNGKCVRLTQGRADQETVYSEDPVSMAKSWEQQGAKYLHLVDLDGAFTGSPKHLDLIAEVVRELNIPCELGGGLRDADTIERALRVGVDRVILGTRAFESQQFVQEQVSNFGGHRIAVGIDAKNGMVSIKGWTETGQLKAVDLARRMVDIGVQTIIYTDISRDGMLGGPNFAALEEMANAVSANIIASGGVSSSRDIQGLKALKKSNLNAAIVGKALYDGQVRLSELLECI